MHGFLPQLCLSSMRSTVPLEGLQVQNQVVESDQNEATICCRWPQKSDSLVLSALQVGCQWDWLFPPTTAADAVGEFVLALAARALFPWP